LFSLVHFMVRCNILSIRNNYVISMEIVFDNSSFETVEEFKYSGTTLKNKNFIQEEIKSRLKSGKLTIIRCRIFCLPVC